jgi:hypothetical protein
MSQEKTDIIKPVQAVRQNIQTKNFLNNYERERGVVAKALRSFEKSGLGQKLGISSIVKRVQEDSTQPK